MLHVPGPPIPDSNEEPLAHGTAARLVCRQRDLAVALNGTSDLNEALHRCLGVAIELSGMDSGGIYLVDPEAGELRLAASVGLAEAFVASVERCAPPQWRSDVVVKGAPIYAAATAPAAELEVLLRTEGIRLAAAIPVRHGGEVIASLNVASHSVARMGRLQRVALETTAAQIGAAIARIRAEHDEQEARRRLADRNAALQRQAAERTAAAEGATGPLLHDNLRQFLVAARLRLRELAGQPAGSRGFEELDELLEQALAECRSLSGRVSPPAGDGGGLDASRTERSSA